ncbi:MAG: Gfo/Idh/MocA family oxidoreductase [Enterocloster asparagiformis]|nr:Gfo/Idh/MocA family oxidoreductase [Enterocloster asparagiformis]
MSMKKYVQVGTGSRARMYYEAICTTFKDTCDLVGFCDLSQTRMDYANRVIQEEYGHDSVPTYLYTEFDRMIDETRPDAVIVTSIDRTHHQYIIRAMEKGCDVITEKPMTIDEKKAQEIIDVQKRTGRQIRVTFNYRYAPTNTKVRQLIMDGVIGDVFSVHFEWLLNTKHGADYYRRWHRNKANSGGLLVHKSTHHFDLVNFWLGTRPETVFAFGGLNFYGKQNAERRGVKDFYYRCYGSEQARNDPFAIDLEGNELFREIYLKAEKDSGYIRDRSVFGDDISIEDTMSVLVRYQNGAQMSYSLNSYMPWEGYIVSFNGSKGRIEYQVREQAYINGGGERADEGAQKLTSIMVYPMFDNPYPVEAEKGVGSHGGGDTVLLNDIFGTPQEDRFQRAASHIDGAMSILTGVAANKSIASGLPVNIGELIKL